MSDWLWRDETSGLGLRAAISEGEAEESAESETIEADEGLEAGDGAAGVQLLEVCVQDEVIAALPPEQAGSLGDALRVWAKGAGPAATAALVPLEGTWFQVYYRPEYTDGDGHVVELPSLGEPGSNGAYLVDAADLVQVRENTERIGRALADAYEALTGEEYGPDVDEHARAWISVFRMPEDVRIWKGFWDELDEVTDQELAGFLASGPE